VVWRLGGSEGAQTDARVRGDRARRRGREIQDLFHRQHQDRTFTIDGLSRRPEEKVFHIRLQNINFGLRYAEYFIRKNFNGAGSATIFSRNGFSGDHVSTLRAVQSGEFDAGALDYRVFEIESKAGRADPSKVQVIWETPPYQDYNFMIQGDLDRIFGPGFKEKVRQVILNLDGISILKQFDRSKFIPAMSSQYLPIEEVYEQISTEGIPAAVASGEK
jgi:phosphonate transport system substrate-binding protein